MGAFSAQFSTPSNGKPMDWIQKCFTSKMMAHLSPCKIWWKSRDARRRERTKCDVFHFVCFFTGRICPKGSSAGISFTHGPIFGVFAPQGRRFAPIKVKFGRDRSSVPNFTLIGSGVGVYGLKN